MKITKKKSGNVITLSAEGRIDTGTSKEFEAEANSVLDEANELVIDFKKLDYISSAGLRVLLTLHKKMMLRGGLKVINVNETVSDIFEVTGFTEILNIE